MVTMLKTSFKIYLLTVFILLASCYKNNQTPLVAGNIDLNPYPQSAVFYLEQAKKAEDDNAKAYYIKAAGRLINDRRLNEASQILKAQSGLSSELETEKYLLLAKINFLKHRNQLALRQLVANNGLNNLAHPLQLYYYQLLAEIYEAQNKYLNAIQTRISLENLLPRGDGQIRNQQKLWLDLNRLSADKLCFVEEDQSAILRGWLALACVVKKQSDANALLQGVNTWQKIYPDHPANRLINPLSSSDLLAKANKIALLVPLKGPLSGPGKAVRDGFLQRYYQQTGERTKIQFYDSGNQDIAPLYQKAVQEGADYVVGPLQRKNVRTLARQAIPVRTLALNDIERSVPANFYQFGLSLKDEAKLVAYKMREAGIKRVLIIAQEGDWGREIANQFTYRFKAHGGEIADSLFYTEEQNMRLAIRALLKVDLSMERGQKLRQALGEKIKFSPTRRGDVDAIFVVAYPSKARQIKPLLDYYFAKDLPIYSTSIVYGGLFDPNKDRDLNGIIFCDMPFVLNQHSIQKQPSWPEPLNRYVRLYAVGMDAFNLNKKMVQLALLPSLGLVGNTGVLFLNANHEIVRQLQWAQFVNGRAIPLS